MITEDFVLWYGSVFRGGICCNCCHVLFFIIGVISFVCTWLQFAVGVSQMQLSIDIENTSILSVPQFNFIGSFIQGFILLLHISQIWTILFIHPKQPKSAQQARNFAVLRFLCSLGGICYSILGGVVVSTARRDDIEESDFQINVAILSLVITLPFYAYLAILDGFAVKIYSILHRIQRYQQIVKLAEAHMQEEDNDDIDDEPVVLVFDHVEGSENTQDENLYRMVVSLCQDYDIEKVLEVETRYLNTPYNLLIKLLEIGQYKTLQYYLDILPRHRISWSKIGAISLKHAYTQARVRGHQLRDIQSILPIELDYEHSEDDDTDATRQDALKRTANSLGNLFFNCEKNVIDIIETMRLLTSHELTSADFLYTIRMDSGMLLKAMRIKDNAISTQVVGLLIEYGADPFKRSVIGPTSFQKTIYYMTPIEKAIRRSLSLFRACMRSIDPEQWLTTLSNFQIKKNGNFIDVACVVGASDLVSELHEIGLRPDVFINVAIQVPYPRVLHTLVLCGYCIETICPQAELQSMMYCLLFRFILCSTRHSTDSAVITSHPVMRLLKIYLAFFASQPRSAVGGFLRLGERSVSVV